MAAFTKAKADVKAAHADYMLVTGRSHVEPQAFKAFVMTAGPDHPFYKHFAADTPAEGRTVKTTVFHEYNPQAFFRSFSLGGFATNLAANLFPMMGETEATELATDLLANGLQTKIIIDREGRIVDGRNRVSALIAAKQSIAAEQVEIFAANDGESDTAYQARILALVLSLNLHRRHLTASQINMINARMATATKADASAMGNAAQGRATPDSNAGVGSSESTQPMTVAEAVAQNGGSIAGTFEARKLLGTDAEAEVLAGKTTVNAAVRANAAAKPKPATPPQQTYRPDNELFPDAPQPEAATASTITAPVFSPPVEHKVGKVVTIASPPVEHKVGRINFVQPTDADIAAEAILGDCAAMTADQARLLAQEHRLAFSKGVDSVALEEAAVAAAKAAAEEQAAAIAAVEAAKVTFAHACARYFQDWRDGNLGRGKPRPASIPSFNSNVARAIAFFGSKGIDEITPMDVRAFKASLMSSKAISAGTASKDLTVTKLVFAYAVDPAFLIPTSPALEVKGLKGSKMRERSLTEDEILAVWEACARIGRHGQLVRFLIATPLRLSMARLATWDQIDLTAKTISISAEAKGNKAAKAMILPLNDLAIEVLESLPFRTGFVFRGIHGDPVCFGTEEKKRLDKHSGVNDWRLHDLRRTVVTTTADHHESIDIDAAETWLQHTRNGILGVYQQSSRMKAMRTVAAQWEATLRGILGLEPAATNVVQLASKGAAA